MPAIPTLAWENTLISPDFVGAMREVIEQHTSAPCLFLQGASGDLGPREGFVGDVTVADRNGRQLGFAALAGIESLAPPQTRFRYTGAIVSGPTLGLWSHDATKVAPAWKWRTFTVDLPYRHDLPTVETTQADLGRWEAEEAKARERGDLDRASICRAHVERQIRQLSRLGALPPGRVYPFRVVLGRAGSTLWVLVPGELYQVFQTALRVRHPESAVIVTTLTNDWQPGYLPTTESYGHGIYQETIAVLAPGSLEMLIESVSRELHSM